MKKHNVYLLVSLAWLLCCIYQIKNDNVFMALFSAAISVLLFAFAVYRK